MLRKLPKILVSNKLINRKLFKSARMNRRNKNQLNKIAMGKKKRKMIYWKRLKTFKKRTK